MNKIAKSSILVAPFLALSMSFCFSNPVYSSFGLMELPAGSDEILAYAPVSFTLHSHISARMSTPLSTHLNSGLHAHLQSQSQEQDLLKEAVAMLTRRDLQIKKLIGEEGTAIPDSTREELKKIINEVIDYGYMAREALQETYSEITQEDRDEFVTLFSSMIRDNSLANPDIYRAKITYDDARQTDGTIFVDTTAELNDVRTTVGYLLDYRANEWHILDMSVDGVSTVESYRRQFQSIIRKRGFEPLLSSLRKRAARNQP